MKHIIIGNSVAGVAAAEAIRQNDAECSITIISDEDADYYSRALLADFIAETTNLAKMLIKDPEFYQQNNITLLTGEKVEQVNPDAREVQMASGKKMYYDRLLIATGASSFLPPVPGVDHEGVFGLRNLADARKILTKTNNVKSAVVIGAGLVGLEVAEAFVEKGIKTTVVEKLPQILPLQLDETAAQLVSEGLNKEGIQLMSGIGFTKINKTSWFGRLFGKAKLTVNLENGITLPADIVVIATGARANVGLVQGTKVEINKGIVVNAKMETTVQDIYAAGDVTESVDAVTGISGPSPIWPNAAKQGKLAGLNMLGKNKTGEALIAMQNSLTLGNVEIISLGIVNPPADAGFIVLTKKDQLGNYKKLVVQDDILVGAVLVGEVEQAGVYGALIKSKRKITIPMDTLMDNNFGYSKILGKFPAKAG